MNAKREKSYIPRSSVIQACRPLQLSPRCSSYTSMKKRELLEVLVAQLDKLQVSQVVMNVAMVTEFRQQQAHTRYFHQAHTRTGPFNTCMFGYYCNNSQTDGSIINYTTLS
ncbi:uncharacterized protein LOC123561211 [Mercenaria mercenaria]|uniref:uncharacterized protein LOC123561211 n=1 Tax=Mercenaria mercenaria TaxID=6596 RepID=UPI00234F1130|nr:uncharacterized protein LOC123561211 [Mercenaria mercenaria]